MKIYLRIIINMHILHMFAESHCNTMNALNIISIRKICHFYTAN